MTSRLRTLTKFQSDDEVVNRLQDHLREVLNPVLGNVAASDVVTTKGDLTVGTGDGAVARLAVGSDGQLPIADSTKDGGIRWGPLPATNPVLGANSTAGQSIPAGSPSIVVFGTVEQDSDSAYNSGTGRYTIPSGKGGDYFITGKVAFVVAITTYIKVQIAKNGTALKTSVFLNAPANQDIHVEAILRLAVADVIDIRAQHADGVSHSLNTDGTSNYFALKRIPD